MFFAIPVLLGFFLGSFITKTIRSNQESKEIAEQERLALEQELSTFEQKIDNSMRKEAIGDSGLVVENYGQGVYYFDYTGKWFGYALASFKSANPDLLETSISGQVERKNDYSDFRADYGATTGHFVTFRKK